MYEERAWKLGEDLHRDDCIFDPITFGELIDTVRCNCKKIDEAAVEREMNRILDIRMQDMKFLLRNNLNSIAYAAIKGREPE